MKRIEDVIRRPIVTEKSTMARKYGNQYVFAVDLKANKQEIKEAVATLFGVKVLAVNTCVMPGKDRFLISSAPVLPGLVTLTVNSREKP